MLLVRIVILWSLISLHIVGAAVLFRRLFPRECPWLGFLTGPLLFLFVLNFIEHFIGMASLIWLLPFTTLGLFWVLFQRNYSWEGLRLPTTVFLLSFAFAMWSKAIHPDIGTNSEGLADLNRILDYCFGETLPPTDSWLPPYNHQWYYSFMMYGASVIKRLFFLDLGSAYNFSFAFLIAFTFLAGSGAAYYISGRRVWVTLTTLFFMFASFTGSSAIIDLLTSPNPNVWLAVNLNTDWNNPAMNPLTWFLKDDPYHEPLKLFPPGMWIWADEYHPTFAGHFLTLSCVLATLAIFRGGRSNWPWVYLLLLPFLTIITSTWNLLVVGFLCAGGLVAAFWAGHRPAKSKVVLFATILGLVLLWPTLVTFTSWSTGQDIGWNRKEWRTPIWLFVFQWWPIYVPWFLLWFVWFRLNFAARWMHLAVGILFICTEIFNVGDLRVNVPEKMWGVIYSAGLVTVVPLVLMQRGWVFRFVSLILALTASISLYCWIDNSTRGIDWRNDALRTEGANYIKNDPQMGRMIQVLQPYRGLVTLAARSEWAYSLAPAIAVFTENRVYSCWFVSESICGHDGESEYRMKLTNDFYDGKCPDPLGFLEENNIGAVLIWPYDKISDEQLALFKQQLATGYRYVDCKVPGGTVNVGIFLSRSLNRKEPWRPASDLPMAPAVHH